LNFIFLRNEVLDFFPGVGKNPKTCSNLTHYAYNNTLVKYLSMKKNPTFNMNVSLNYNNIFKWRGPLDIKKDGHFWYPKHVLTHKGLRLWMSSVYMPLRKQNLFQWIALLFWNKFKVDFTGKTKAKWTSWFLYSCVWPKESPWQITKI
jgi:hypothetical protein